MVKIVSEALDAIRSAHLERAREDNDYGHVESREFAVEEAAEEFDRMIAAVECAAAVRALRVAAVKHESEYGEIAPGLLLPMSTPTSRWLRAEAIRREETE